MAQRTFVFGDKADQRLLELQRELGVNNPAEVVRIALSLLDRCLQAKSNGADIMAIQQSCEMEEVRIVPTT